MSKDRFLIFKSVNNSLRYISKRKINTIRIEENPTAGEQLIYIHGAGFNINFSGLFEFDLFYDSVYKDKINIKSLVDDLKEFVIGLWDEKQPFDIKEYIMEKTKPEISEEDNLRDTVARLNLDIRELNEQIEEKDQTIGELTKGGLSIPKVDMIKGGLSIAEPDKKGGLSIAK